MTLLPSLVDMPAVTSTAHAWLWLAYGEQEASEAMALPSELRMALYGDVLLYGPAGNEIAACLASVKEVLSRSETERITLNKALAGIYLGWYDTHLFAEACETLTNWVVTHPEVELASVFSRTSHDVPGLSSENAGGLNFLMWLLTGQYLFRSDEIVMSSSYAVKANAILASLALPELRPTFVYQG